MTDPSKIKASHRQRVAYVYIRQSTPGQVEHNRESTARQYALADRAGQLGWSKQQVVVIDEDLGLSGSTTDKRSGLLASPAKSRWLTWASSSAWRSLVWPATMPIGIACWSCAA
jgi:Resolvase, N terminal domain